MHNRTSSEKLRIITLGQYKIISKAGSPYIASNKQFKLCKLFKFLLINQNKEIAPEIILEVLSPEMEYGNPQNVIQNMVYRLRKLLTSENLFDNGKEVVSYNNGGYKLNTQDIWVDFMEFEHLINQADSMQKTDPLVVIESFKMALDLYGGELLPELIYDDWIIPKRTYYQRLHHKIIINLARLYTEQKEYEAIVQICHKAIAIEPHEEEFHIPLIENLIKLGKIREAKTHYEDTVRFFEKEFGIKPTPEMQKLAQMLASEYRPFVITNKNAPPYLLDQEKNKGSFYCDYSVFYAIYALEKRRCERTGDAVCPVYIRFENEKNIFKTNALKNSAVKDFKNILYKSLRKGDMITLINKTTFLILLFNTEYPLVKFVLDRIIKKFNEIEAYRDISLEIEVCTSLPKTVR